MIASLNHQCLNQTIALLGRERCCAIKQHSTLAQQPESVRRQLQKLLCAHLHLARRPAAKLTRVTVTEELAIRNAGCIEQDLVIRTVSLHGIVRCACISRGEDNVRTMQVCLIIKQGWQKLSECTLHASRTLLGELVADKPPTNQWPCMTLRAAHSKHGRRKHSSLTSRRTTDVQDLVILIWTKCRSYNGRRAFDEEERGHAAEVYVIRHWNSPGHLHENAVLITMRCSSEMLDWILGDVKAVSSFYQCGLQAIVTNQCLLGNSWQERIQKAEMLHLPMQSFVQCSPPLIAKIQAVCCMPALLGTSGGRSDCHGHTRVPAPAD
mmetsp:Transcript_81917/g.149725  ORF Transcript_81917/g.149725 Transcript_81917/m.149725 type:complete len:323 (+) Transcript_81917:115-1083(+)